MRLSLEVWWGWRNRAGSRASRGGLILRGEHAGCPMENRHGPVEHCRESPDCDRGHLL